MTICENLITMFPSHNTCGWLFSMLSTDQKRVTFFPLWWQSFCCKTIVKDSCTSSIVSSTSLWCSAIYWKLPFHFGHWSPCASLERIHHSWGTTHNFVKSTISNCEEETIQHNFSPIEQDRNKLQEGNISRCPSTQRMQVLWLASTALLSFCVHIASAPNVRDRSTHHVLLVLLQECHHFFDQWSHQRKLISSCPTPHSQCLSTCHSFITIKHNLLFLLS